MGGYVQMDKDLEDDPRVSALAGHILDYLETVGVPRVLRDMLKPIARNAALGTLYRLWRHGDTHLKRDDRLHEALRDLADVTGLPITVLRNFPEQWLIEHEDGTLELPDYSKKNTLLNKDQRREGNRLRQQRHRQKKRQEDNALHGVTRHNSNRDTSVTTGPGTGPGPGPVPTIPGPGPLGEGSNHPASSAGELASATGRLARREAKANGKHREGKSREQIEHDIDRLADAGMASAAIAHALQQYGVSISDVNTRLANRLPSTAVEESGVGGLPQ